jgi:hypothetical protein
MYQYPIGSVTTFILASPITIELHRAAVDAYASQPLGYYKNIELTAATIRIGWYHGP